MPEFQQMTGRKLPTSITTVVGSSMSLKLVAGPKEKLPSTITVEPLSFAVLQEVSPRPKQNFTTFKLIAIMTGTAKLWAGSDSRKPDAGPISISIESKLVLPAADTEQGLLMRVFLAEVVSPEGSKEYNDKAAEESMMLMRVVIANRLAKPSGKYGSAGAKSVFDVIRAKGQFAGFESYPTLSSGIAKNIDDAVRIANDGGDGRREKYRRFVELAQKVAALPSVKDPSSKGIYWWRTANHGSPGGDTQVYKTLLDNTFYMQK